MKDLLPCPFCGSEAEEYRENTLKPLGMYGIRCGNLNEDKNWCRVSPDTDLNGLRKNVVDCWNKRADLTPKTN